MNLERVAEKLAAMAKKIDAEKGPLELLGLFLRENARGLWDLVVAAPWLREDKRASYKYIDDQMQEALTEEDLLGISHIVILDHGSTVLKSFLDRFGNLTGPADVLFETEGGAVIEQEYLILARPLAEQPRRQKPKKARCSKASSQGSSRSSGDISQ
jgi:hypothetical protein